MFFARLVQQFLSKAAAADPQDRGTKALLERYLELFVDLEVCVWHLSCILSHCRGHCRRF